MKKIAALSASVLLTAALATSVSADPATTTAETNEVPTVVGQTVEVTGTSSSQGSSVTDITYLDLDEPIVSPDEVILAPKPITLTKITYFYETPGGKALSALAPQKVSPTGQIVNNWVEIYTWLGKAWIYLPGYTPTY